MANSYFKFKQFTIHQDKCAMKVCTDACLFGALVAGCRTCLPAVKPPMNIAESGAQTCLDIGTGTGLLSLMVAQKNKDIQIDAIEIDEDAAGQAAANITASPWAGRVQVIQGDVLNIKTAKKYDCIISNPPFYENDLPAQEQAKNAAKHDSALSFAQLLQVVDARLEPAGFFAVLLPYHRVNYFISEAEKVALFLSKQVSVKHTLKHKFFRGILFFSRKQVEPQYTEVIIRDADQNYTPAFTSALKDYYLFL